jgi:hypothetical protein
MKAGRTATEWLDTTRFKLLPEASQSLSHLLYRLLLIPSMAM